MSDENSSPPLQPDELLPPVEPPSAAFLVQLFVIPGLIVVAIVSVWLMFGWIVSRGADRPEAMIQGLEGSGATRWQRASDLADMLRNDRYPEFRRNAAAATQLGNLLERELQAASGRTPSENTVNLLYFLCRALGEFQVSEGIDVLIDAATAPTSDDELLVRRGAIQAIAVRLYQASQADPPVPLDLARYEAALIGIAADKNPLIRSEVAFALGRLATPAALKQLAVMMDDPHADTRYNAALGLASAGQSSAAETLAEMLEPGPLPSVQEEVGFESQLVKRAIIVRNALQGVRTIVEKSPQADLSGVATAIRDLIKLTPDQLRQARIDPLLIGDAQATLELLERAPLPAAADNL